MRQHMQLCSKFTAIARSQSNLSGATSDKATALLFIPRTKFSGACPHGLTSFLSQGPSLSHSTCQPASLPLQAHRPSFAQPLPSLQQALSLHRALAPTVLSLFCPQPGPSSRSHLAGIVLRKASSVSTASKGEPLSPPHLCSVFISHLAQISSPCNLTQSTTWNDVLPHESPAASIAMGSPPLRLQQIEATLWEEKKFCLCQICIHFYYYYRY